MSIKKNDFEVLLREKFPNSIIEVIDTAGDEDHYRIKIASPEFTNLTRLQKHRIVNEKLKGYIGEKIHATEFILS